MTLPTPVPNNMSFDTGQNFIPKVIPVDPATGLAPTASTLIGKVAIDQTTPGSTNLVALTSQGYSASVSITRPNDTDPYAAKDVIGAATGSTAAQTFASMGPSAGRIIITSVEYECDSTALISGETTYTLHLYNVTPPSALGDNAAWDLAAGDRASYLGFINLGTPLDLVSTLYLGTNGVNKQLKLTGTSLFAYLVTEGAFTPAASTVRKITLHAVSV